MQELLIAKLSKILQLLTLTSIMEMARNKLCNLCKCNDKLVNNIISKEIKFYLKKIFTSRGLINKIQNIYCLYQFTDLEYQILSLFIQVQGLKLQIHYNLINDILGAY